MERDIYPLTIISDRYNGCYSLGKFLAFNLDRNDIPDDVGGGDPDEWTFFQEDPTDKYDTHHNYLIGRGNTPQEAFDDLYNLIHSL